MAYLRHLLARFESVPGAGPAAFSSRPPLDPAYGVSPVAIEGRPVPAGDDAGRRRAGAGGGRGGRRPAAGAAAPTATDPASVLRAE